MHVSQTRVNGKKGGIQCRLKETLGISEKKWTRFFHQELIVVCLENYSNILLPAWI